MRQVILLARSRHDPRRVREHIVHLLQWYLLCLGQKDPEKDGVGEIADEENEVELICDLFHGNRRDLADHGVEGERSHGGNRHALGPGARVKDLCRDYPGEWTTCRREGEVVHPGHDDEPPVCTAVLGAWGEPG